MDVFNRRRSYGALAVALMSLGATAGAQVAPPDYGIDFVTIGAVGNAPYPGPDPFPFVTGRGQVNYEYRIGRTEITTSQWMQFVNTFSTQRDDLALFAAPSAWGAVPDPNYNGPGRRWMLRPNTPNAGIFPVFSITWRDAAKYCNWLCNGQSSSLDSLDNGAYDTSTFGDNPDGTFGDQRTHNPGARFWIPTFDEWIKAAHYDPNRFGPGQGGYWQYDTSSDSPPVPGPPGMGQTSAGYHFTPFQQFDVPLGAYPGTLSPWGLLDTSGGAKEWTEETFEEFYHDRRVRWADGAIAGDMNLEVDRIGVGWTDFPSFRSLQGIRIASTIPSPPLGPTLLLGFGVAFASRRRQ